MLIETLVRDLRLAVRQLLRSPLSTAAAVATLAIGIGANIAMFSVAEAVLWRPPAYAEPERLVVFGKRLSAGDVGDVRRDARSFSAVGAYSNVSVTVLGSAGEPERVAGASVSSDWFELLGRRPILGRGFLPGGERGRPAEVVLGDAFWRNRYGADPGVLGKTIRINDESLTVVGVMPADFELVSDEELWMPLDGSPRQQQDRDLAYLRVYARLRPGVTATMAQAELDAIASRLAKLYPDTDAGRSFHLLGLQQAIAGSSRSPLLLLLGAVGFLMLLVCGNLTHLELANAAAHRHEAAIRIALGAGPGQVLRERLTRAVVLALLGGGCGVLLASWGTRLLAALAASLDDSIPRLGQTRVDGRVLLFALLLSLGTGLAFGLLPAVQAARANLRAMLQEATARASGSVRSRYLRGALLVSEVALALVLLVGAGLLVQSLRRLLDTQPGFRPERCAAMRVVLPRDATAAAEAAFAHRTLDNIRALPGVAGAGLITNVPLTTSRLTSPIWIEGLPAPPAGQEPEVDLDAISEGYFDAMGTPLLRGRPVLATDRADTPPVAVVNHALAQRFWPAAQAQGMRISLEGAHGPWVTVVGVAGDVKRSGLDRQVAPQLYLPFPQAPQFFMTFVVRTAGSPLTVVPDLRRAVWATAPAQAVAWVRPMTEVVAASLSKTRFVTMLLTLFAVIALTLAAVGTYGVMAHSVSQRRQEIAVRLALGAKRSDVMRLVLGHALALTLGGLALGLGSAIAMSRFLKGFVFGVSSTDPVTLAVISLVVAGTAMVATYLPARRAARVAPSTALKLG